MAAESDPACPDDSLAAKSGTEPRMGASGGGPQLTGGAAERWSPRRARIGVRGVAGRLNTDGDSSDELEDRTEHGVVGRLVSGDADDDAGDDEDVDEFAGDDEEAVDNEEAGDDEFAGDDEAKVPETEEEAEREWQQELQRLRTSEYPSDRSISALFDRRWGDSIDKDTLVKHIMNDAVYGTIFKILAEEADVLRIVLPRVYREDLLRGVYSLKNGLLYHRKIVNGVLRTGYVIPPKCRHDILEYFHSSLSTLHQGQARMLFLMNGRVYWRGMPTDITDHCDRCESCRVAKATPKRTEGFLQLFPAHRPFEVVHLDIVGPLPLTRNGNRYILSMLDRFSRMVKLVCLPTITASTIAMAFRNHWLLEYGSPMHILTDRGSYFTGLIFKLISKLHGF